MWMRIGLTLLCLGYVGCGDEAKGTDADAAINDMGMTTDGAADMGGGCQPTSKHEELLTAPTTADVVHKTPTHPPVGDGGLP